MSAWSLVYENYNPKHERLREALCTLGNGYFATRGAAPEAHADDAHYPGTYLAGAYNRLRTEIAGETVENESLVNMPNWLPLTLRLGHGAGDQWLDLRRVQVLSYRQELDLRRGLLLREVLFEDGRGRRTRLAQRRLVHVREKHMAGFETTLTADNWSGGVEIRSALDGRVTNSGVPRYSQLESRHLEPLETDAPEEDTLYLRVRTNQSHIHVAEAARTRFYRGAERFSPSLLVECDEGWAAQEFALDLAEGEPVTIEKIAALYSSRDDAISEPGLEARKAVARAPRFERLAASQALAWGQLWQRFDLELHHTEREEEEGTSRILRLHVFHLLQTVSLNSMDLDVGVPARGWHGEAYRGHILWDELFIFPLLNLRIPEITRTVLKYRYRRLGEARAAANEAGHRGAMFPWQSGSDGREESQTLHLNPASGRWIADNSRLQRHVNSAIAYNVWQYFQVTGDVEFLSFYGAELILEIARFWASLAVFNDERGRYEIRGVMGPDEFHERYPGAEQPGLNNNAYTNVMAAWALIRAFDLPRHLPARRWRELCELLRLAPEELERWEDVSRRIFVPFHDDGIISQFEGYERLEELDWEGLRTKHGDIQRLDRLLKAEGDTPDRYKASKQADVLMLFYVFSAEELGELFERLGYRFDGKAIPKNIAYYLARTSHGSTLSRIVHSWVLARSDRARSWGLFHQALQSDVKDIQGGTTEEGIHLGAMAGTVDLMQRGYTGIESRGEALHLNPALPDDVASLSMRIRYRGHSLDLRFGKESVSVEAEASVSLPIRISLGDEMRALSGGEKTEFVLKESR